MMRSEQLIEKIAQERFLDMRANGVDATRAANLAVDEAELFFRTLESRIEKPISVQTKGCPVCYGSGGKKNIPCRNCGGSGRVTVSIGE